MVMLRTSTTGTTRAFEEPSVTFFSFRVSHFPTNFRTFDVSIRCTTIICEFHPVMGRTLFMQQMMQLNLPISNFFGVRQHSTTSYSTKNSFPLPTCLPLHDLQGVVVKSDVDQSALWYSALCSAAQIHHLRFLLCRNTLRQAFYESLLRSPFDA